MNKYIKYIGRELTRVYGEEISEKATEIATHALIKLCEENKGDSKAIKAHTEKEIYPMIALYRGIIKAGVDAKDAENLLDRCYSKMAIPKANAMRSLCKLPGMMKKMPAIFTKVARKQFGEKQGFVAHFYDTEKTRSKFDMTTCLYYDTCKKYDALPIVKCFCHADDVTDGNIHPRLKWNRTMTMGEGADKCDFDLYVVDKK